MYQEGQYAAPDPTVTLCFGEELHDLNNAKSKLIIVQVKLYPVHLTFSFVNLTWLSSTLVFYLSFIDLSSRDDRLRWWTASICSRQWTCVVHSRTAQVWRCQMTQPLTRWPTSTKTSAATVALRGQPATGTTCLSLPEAAPDKSMACIKLNIKDIIQIVQWTTKQNCDNDHINY